MRCLIYKIIFLLEIIFVRNCACECYTLKPILLLLFDKVSVNESVQMLTSKLFHLELMYLF